MNKYIFILLFLSFSCLSLGQSDFKWEVGMNYGHQFNINKNGQEFINILGLNKRGDRDYGIQQLGVYVMRRFVDRSKWSLQGGLSVSKERVASSLVINHCYGYEFCTFDLRLIQGYSVDMIGLPVEANYFIHPKIILNLGVNPQIRFHQNGSTDREPKSNIELHSIEMYTGLEYNLNRIVFGLSYRLLNMKKPDPTYELSNKFLAENPEYYNQTFDYQNPLKLRLTVGYKFGMR